MTRLRTFLAVDLGEGIRQRLVELQEILARSTSEVKWVERENLHLTLLFLGEIDERDIHEICRACAEVCSTMGRFSLSVEGVGSFPNSRRPRTLWAGVGVGSQELIELHDALESKLEQLGCYRREQRPFTPHITLGRVKGERPPDRLPQALLKQADYQAGDGEVEAVRVMASELTPQGPIYTVLSTAELADSRPL